MTSTSQPRRRWRRTPRVCRIGPTIGVLLHLLRGCEVLVMNFLQNRQRHSHVLGQGFARFVELHDTTPSVVLAMPVDFISSSLVQTEAEGRLVLPHFASP